MGWARLDTGEGDAVLDISGNGAVSLGGIGLLRTSGEIVTDGLVQALQSDVRVMWSVVSREALRLPSELSQSALASMSESLFPGFASWVKEHDYACAAMGVHEDALELDWSFSDLPADLTKLACVLLVLPEQQWRFFERWLRPNAERRTKAIITFSVFGMPTPSLRQRLSDTWQSMGKGFDPLTRYMAEFAERPDVRVLSFDGARRAQ
jgi:hypothetical protein